MNKADLLDVLEGRLGSRKTAADAIEAIVDVIIREVAAGGKVGITGFGTFETSARAARTGRNPRTGETVRIEATTIPKFRPGTQFKEVVAHPDRLPAQGLAGTRTVAAPTATPSRRATTPRATTSSAAAAGTHARTVADVAAEAVETATKKAPKAPKSVKTSKAAPKKDKKKK